MTEIESEIEKRTNEAIAVIQEFQKSINTLVQRFDLGASFHPLSVLDVGLFGLLCQIQLSERAVKMSEREERAHFEQQEMMAKNCLSAWHRTSSADVPGPVCASCGSDHKRASIT